MSNNLKKPKKFDLPTFLIDNMVTIFFVLLSVAAFIISNQDLTYFARELVSRFANNAFLVLALIIPILTGMGLNFSIVIGAMAGQLGIYIAVDRGISGIAGITLAALIGSSLSVLLGFLVGKLFNRMKGSETVGGMVLGYFAEGIYQFIFLILIGGVIKVQNTKLLISGKSGVLNAIDLNSANVKLKYAVDETALIKIVDPLFYIIVGVVAVTLIYNCLIKNKPLADYKNNIVALAGTVLVYGISFIPAVQRYIAAPRLDLLPILVVVVFGTIGYSVLKIVLDKVKDIKDTVPTINRVRTIVIMAVIYALTYVPSIEKMVLATKIPSVTFAVIGLGCLFNSWIMSTRLGQNMRTAGQDRAVANSAGIKVDKTRIIAVIFSTVLASIGQILFLQGLGTFNTYGAHTDVGFNAVASLLVGGASVNLATSKQALLGVLLFHSLAILAPKAATVLFGDPQIGEYFRAFLTFAVIALSLAMYAYGNNKKAKAASQ